MSRHWLRLLLTTPTPKATMRRSRLQIRELEERAVPATTRFDNNGKDDSPPWANTALQLANPANQANAIPVIVVGSATGSPPDSPAAHVDPNTTSSTWAGVGAVSAVSGFGSFIGTGTPISSRHILTAAHVVDHDGNGTSDISLGSSAFVLNYGSDFSHILGISAVTVHPNYTGFANPAVNDDLAILTLTTDLPAGVPIYPINLAPFNTVTQITSVGYGTSGDGVNGFTIAPAFNVKRVGANLASQFVLDDEGSGSREGFEFDFDGPTQNYDGLAGLGNHIETTFGGGDSGGPSFIPDGSGGQKIFGVNTYIFGAIQAAPLFGSGAGGMVVATYAPFIQSPFSTITANFDPAPGNQAGDGSADTIVLRRNPSNTAQLQILVNGNQGLLVPYASLPNVLTVNGSTDNDTLTLDYTYGNPLPAGGLNYNGGIAGNDAMRIVGSGLSATYTPSATTNGNGTITVGGTPLNFTGLEPIDYDVVGGTFNLTLPGANDLVTVANSTLIDGLTPALQISGSSGGVGFENARVRGSAITIDTTTVAGTDVISITSASNAHTNTSLTVTTGTELGDQINITGGVNFSGTVSLSATDITSTAAGTIASSALTVTNSGTASNMVGVISGTGTTVTKNGTGTLTLSGANTYTGTTNVNAGTLSATNASALGTTAGNTSVAASATLDVQANIGTEPLSLAGALISSTTGTVGGTVTLTANAVMGGAGSLSVTGVISGAFGISKNDSGTTTWTNTGNSFTGNVDITGGVLAFSGQGNANPTVLGGGVKNITLTNNAVLRPTSSSDPSATSKSFIIGAGGGTFDAPTGVTFLLNDPSQLQGTGLLTITGAGATTLGGAYTNTGGVLVNGGTLQIASSSTVTAGAITNGPIGTGLLTVAGGTIRTDGTARTIHNSLSITGDFTMGASSGSNNLTIQPSAITSPSAGTITLAGARTITVPGNGQTLDGRIDGISTPSLTKAGGADLILANNTGTTSTFGNVVINAGRLFNSGNNAANMQNTLGAGSYTVNNTGTLAFNNSGNVTFSPTNTFVINSGGNLSMRQNTINMPATTTLPTAGSLLLNRDDTGAGGIAFPSTVTIGLTGDLTIQVGNPITNSLGHGTGGSARFDGVISGGFNLIKTGNGALGLNAANTYTGTTSVLLGTLRADVNAPSGTAGAFGNSTTPIVVGDSTAGQIYPILNLTPTFTTTLVGNLDYPATGNLDTANGPSVGADNFTGLWTGSVTVTTAGTYTFGTSSDDGSIFLLDLNNDGRYNATSELIVNNNPGVTSRVGSVYLPVGTYSFATAMYEGTGGDNMTVRFAPGAVGIYGLSGMTIVAPGATAGGLTFNSPINAAFTSGATNGRLLAPATATVAINNAGVSVGRDLTLVGAGRTAESIQYIPASGTGTFSGAIGIGEQLIANVASGGTLATTGVISGGGMVKMGAGTMTPINANTYTGSTEIFQGVLQITADNQLGAAPAVPTPGSLWVYGGATLRPNASFTINANRGMVIGQNMPPSPSASVTMPVSTNTSTFTASTVNSVSLANIDVPTGFTTVYDGIITDVAPGTGGSLTKAGAGILQLGGTSTYTGTTNVNTGTLRSTAATGLGSTSLGTYVASGGSVILDGTTPFTTGESFYLVGAGVSSAGALQGAGGNVTVTGEVTVRGATTIGSGTAGATLALNGNLRRDFTNADLTFTGAGNTSVAGNITPATLGYSLSPWTGRIFSATGLAPNTVAGINSLTGASPPASLRSTKTLNGELNFANDTTINNFFGVNQTVSPFASDVFTATFTSTLTVTNPGLYNFGFSANDDNSTIWVDLNQNNTFEANEQVVTGGITNTTGYAVNLAAGNYLIAYSNEDTGGNSSLVGRILGPTNVLVPSATNYQIPNSAFIPTPGGQNIVKSGTGTLTLGGINTYFGETRIDAGTVAVSSDANLGTAYDGSVGNLVVTGAGAGYTSPPTVTITGGGGTGAAGVATFAVASSTVTSQGSGYTSIPSISVSAPTNPGITAQLAAVLGVVTIPVTNGGSGYTSAPTVTVSGGGGSGTTATANITAGAVTSITITTTGSLYSSVPTVTLTGGGGTGATADAVLGVTSIAVITAGAGYSAAPSLTISGGGGTGATGTASLASTVSGIAVTNGGTGYISTPTVSITGGGATTNATAVAAVKGLVRLTGGGTLQGTATFTSPRAVFLNGPGAVDATTGNNLTLTGVVNGAQPLTKTGAGTVTLSATNTFTGTTTVNAGTLALANGAAIVDSVSVVVNAGTLDLQNSETIGSLAGAAGTSVTLNANNLTTGGNNSSTAFTGSISGTGSLNKSGTGTFTLSGANSYTGATNITGGTLTVSGSLSDSTDVTVAASTTYNVAASDTIDGLSGTGSVTLGANTLTLGGNNETTATHTGVLSGAGGGLTKTGTGTQIIGGASANTYTGTTTINNGTLTLAAGQAIANTGSVVMNGGTLNITANETIGSLSGVAASTVTLNGNTLTTGDATNTTYAGVISGAGGALTKIGAGALNLTGANSYSGTTTVNDGTLFINGAVAGPVVVNSPSTLAGSGAVTGNVSGNGTFAPGNSPGIFTINGNFTPTGTLILEVNPPASTPGVDHDQYVVNGAVNLSGATLTFAGATGAVAPNQLLTLIANDAADLTSPSANPAEGATVTINGNSYRLYFNGGSGNDVVLVQVSAQPTVYVDDSWSLLTNGTVIADADLGTTGNQPAVFGVNAFTRIGAGITNSTASATIVVNGGTYAETVTSSGTKTIEITGADAAQTVTITGAFTTVAGQNVVIDGTSTLDLASGNVAGLISGSGNLVKNTTGTLILSGNNTYTGLTTLNRGTTTLQSATALGGTGVGGHTIVNGNDGSTSTTLQINPATGITIAENLNLSANATGRVTLLQSAQANTLTGAINVSSTGNLVQFSSNSGSLTITGDITGTMTGGSLLFLRGTSTSTLNHLQGSVNLTGGNLAKTDTGTWLVGAPSKTYSWVNTQVAVGTLQMGAANVLPASGGIIMGQNDNNTTTLNLANFNQTTADITFNRSSTTSGVATITTGTGILTLNGNLTHNGTTATAASVISGNLNLGGGSRTFNIANAPSSVDLNLNNLNLTNGSLVKTGAGLLQYTGASTSLNLTQVDVSAGTLQHAGGGATYTVGGGTGKTNVASGAVFVSNTGALINTDLDIATGGTARFTATTSPSVGSLSGGGNLILGNTTGTGTIPFTLGSNNLSRTFTGTISEATGYVGSLTKAGSGTQTLGGMNTYTGTTTINAGTLSLANGAAIIDTGAVSVNGTATLNLANSETIGSLSGVAGTTVTLNGNTLTTGDATNTTYAGVISGAGGALTKIGAGALNLTGANSYSGTTTVNDGTLFINGAVAGPVVVNSPSTLGGSGTVTGNVSGNGTFAPGNSPGIFTINGNFTPTGTLILEVNPPASTPGVDHDQYVVNGAVNLSGATLTFAGATGSVTPNQLLTLIANDAADLTSPSANPAEGATVTINGNSYRLYYNGGSGNDVVLVQVSAQPTVYVDDSWSLLTNGTVIADADLGTTGNQPAIYGVSAFATLTAGLAATTSSGTIIVNGGTYAETVTASGTQSIEITGPDAAQSVVLSALNTVSGQNVILEGASTLTLGDASTSTVGGVVSGTGSFVKSGTGTVILTAANTYTGNTTISQGTLQVGNAGTSGSIAAVSTVTLGDTNTAANNVAFLVNRSDANTHANPIVVSALGSGSATIGSSGTSGGALGTVFTGPVTLNRATTMQGTDPDRTTYQGIISGNVGTLTINGGGRTTWEANNTFVGDVQVATSGTTLQVGPAGNQVPDTSNLNLATGTFLTLNGDGEVINALTGTGTVQNVIGANTLTIGANNGGGTFAGVFNNGSGALSVTKTGNGSQTIAGTASSTNPASGVLTVAGGTLIVGAGFIGDGAWQGNVTINAATTLQLAQSNVFNNGSDFTINGTLNMAGFSDVLGNISGAGAITNNGGLVLDDIGTTYTYNGTIAGSSFTLRGTIANSGTQILGGTTYNFSSVVVGRSTLTFANTPTVGITGTFAVGDTNGAAVSSGAITAVANLQGGTFTIGHIEVGNRQSGSATVASTINQTGGTVSVTGAPVDSANIRVGHWPSTTTNYNLSAGTLTVANAVGTGVDGTGTFTLSGTGILNTPQIIVNLRNSGGNGTFNLNAGLANIGAGGITTTGGPSALNLGGATLRATATWSSSLAANLTNATGPAIFDTNGFNITMSGAQSGVGGLNKTGTGTLTLSGVNTYSGVTNVNAGTLTLSGGSAIADAGVVNVNGGTLNLTSSETIGSLAGVAGTNVTLNANGLTTGGNNGTTTYAGVMSGTGTLTKQGNGIFTLSGANTFSGQTTINSGTLSLSGGAALDDASPVVLNTGSLDIATSETIRSLQGAAGTAVTLNANTLTTGNGTNTTHAGTITGTGNLVKQGTGIFTLTGTNPYSGTTTVNAGTLLVNGANSGGGTTTVNNPATLGGSGSIAGPVTVVPGATLSPGSPVTAVESLNTGNLTLNSGSTFNVQLGGTTPATQHDQVVTTGIVNLGGATLNVTALAHTPSIGNSYVIIDNDSTDAVIGTFAGLPQGAVIPPFLNFLGSGLTAYIVYNGGDGNDVVITVNTPPSFTPTNNTISENGIASSTIVITDPDPLSITTYTAQINWGEGTPDVITGLGNANATGTVGATSYTWSAATKTLVITHQYLDDNPTNTASDNYTLTVKIADNYMNGNFAGTASTNNYTVGTATITVNNVAPSATTSVLPQYDPIIVRNSLYTFRVTNIVDPGSQDTFTITWNFGDGSPIVTQSGITQAMAAGPHDATYNFPTPGVYTVTITVKDDDTGTAVYTYTEDVRVVVVMPNGDLHIGGSDGNDVIQLDPGLTPNNGSQNVRVFMNGVYYGMFGPVAGPGITATFTGAVRVFGGLGVDSVQITGRTDDDAFTIDDDVVPPMLVADKSFSLNGRTFTTLNAESYFLRGLDGNDTFTINGLGLTGSANTRNVSIEGGNGDDILIAGPTLLASDVGLNGIADWTIEGPQRGNLEGVLKFNTIQAIEANDIADDFTINNGGSMPGTSSQEGIAMAGGDNILDLALVAGGTVITAQADGTLVLSLSTVSGVDTLIGTAGPDRFVGANQTNIWDISATNAGIYTSDTNDPITWSGLESLTGGNAGDTFNFLANGALTGSVDGGLGSDTISYSTRLTNVATLIATTKTTSVAGTWTSIENLVGGTGTNTLTGANSVNTWTLTDVNDGTVNTLNFTDYGNLLGGSGVDSFLLGANGEIDSVNGGGGNDILSYVGAAGPVNVTLTTTSNGFGDRVTNFTSLEAFVGSGNAGDTLTTTPAADTILITGANSGKVNTTTSFSAFANLNGAGGNDNYTIQTTGATLTNIAASAGTDTLTGANRLNTWTLTGAGAGNLNGMTFSGIENLTGGANVDTMDFSGGSIIGTANGGSGSDVLNVGANNVTMTTLGNGWATGLMASFLSFENFLSTGGTLTAPNTANTWRLTGLNVGTLNSTIAFNGFANYNGGTGQDRLYVQTGGVSGLFNAGGGTTDTIDYTGVSLPMRSYNPVYAGVGPLNVYSGLLGNPFMAISNFELIAGNL